MIFLLLFNVGFITNSILALYTNIEKSIRFTLTPNGTKYIFLISPIGAGVKKLVKQNCTKNCTILKLILYFRIVHTKISNHEDNFL
jgi:hypothetical protein